MKDLLKTEIARMFKLLEGDGSVNFNGRLDLGKFERSIKFGARIRREATKIQLTHDCPISNTDKLVLPRFEEEDIEKGIESNKTSVREKLVSQNLTINKYLHLVAEFSEYNQDVLRGMYDAIESDALIIADCFPNGFDKNDPWTQDMRELEYCFGNIIIKILKKLKIPDEQTEKAYSRFIRAFAIHKAVTYDPLFFLW